MSMLLFVTHRLWSIFGDSGSVVSSVVSSDPALLSFHMLTGNLDRAHSVVPAGLVGIIALAIAAWGWQTTAKVMGLVLLVVILPLAACITEAPEQRGLTMDGDPPGGVPHPPHPAGARRRRWTPPVWRPPEEYSVRQALRPWAFWNLTGGTALRLLAKTGATVHII